MAVSTTSAESRWHRTRVWERPTSGAVAWLVQRVTGALLLVSVPVKVWSGWALVGKVPGGGLVASLHVTAWIDAVLVTAVIFHALYGLRAILIDVGLSRFADRLFVLFTILGVILSAVGVAIAL